MDFLKEYLRDDLRRVVAHIDEVLHPEGALMGEVASYVGALRGKLLRPSVLCLSARAFGYDATHDKHCRLGAAMELFHVATLLHDDVIDHASERRGRATVNAKWGNDVAILFADYLYASCFDLAMSVLDPDVLRVITKTTQRMTEGEMYQIEKRGQWLTLGDYDRIIRSKTALLFGACAGLGAVVAKAPPRTVTSMTDFGMYFGVAFQITDDTLDYEAQEDRWGKRVGSDVAEGKQTLPLLHTLDHASPEDRALLVRTLEGDRDFETIHALVKKYRGIDAALERAGECSRDALALLDAVGTDNEATRLLRTLAEGVLVRQY